MPPFAGAVLTGGRSTRMGTDKALLPVNGRPLALIAAEALRGAGATEVFAVGGDRDGLEDAGLRWVADSWPGEGPLGGVITALGSTDAPVVVVLACDLPRVVPAAVAQVVSGLGDADAALAWAHDRLHPLVAAYRRSVRDLLRRAFEGGERSLRVPLGRLQTVAVTLADPAWATNANQPDEVRVTDRTNRS